VLRCFVPNRFTVGSCNGLGNPNSGIFVNLMEIVCHFDIELQQHIITHKDGLVNYFFTGNAK
jgi:hypothetical protein